MKKINKKQLEELQKISSFITDLQTEIARNTINNHKLAHAYSQQEIKLNELKKELQEKYGNITVDVKTGEIEKQQDNEQANKEN